jgi:hypothetical protein
MPQNQKVSAVSQIKKYYRYLIKERGQGQAPVETYTTGNGTVVDNCIGIPVKLLNALLKESYKKE